MPGDSVCVVCRTRGFLQRKGAQYSSKFHQNTIYLPLCKSHGQKTVPLHNATPGVINSGP